MNNFFELATFDQTALFLFLASGLGLIRERRVLPFLLVAVGSLAQGSWIILLVSSLLVWYRVDRGSPRWIQIKDWAGLFLILAASLSGDTFQAFLNFFGVLLLSFSFGSGGLGTIPALLLLRQVYPHPEFLELTLGGAVSYWVFLEVFRGFKVKQGQFILPYLETLGSVLVLFSFKNEMEKWSSDPNYLIAGCVFLVCFLALGLWIRLNGAGFRSFGRSFRSRMLKILTGGGKWVGGAEPWAKAPPESGPLDFEMGLDQAVYWFAGIGVFVVVFLVVTRGGFG